MATQPSGKPELLDALTGALITVDGVIDDEAVGADVGRGVIVDVEGVIEEDEVICAHNSSDVTPAGTGISR